jgi:hypothetical protein
MAVRKIDDEGVHLYPLDIKALEKGDYIPPEMCEERTKCKDRNHKNYSLELEAFKERIDLELMRLGRNWTLRCRKDGIAILIDAEASEHNEASFDALKRGLRRRARKNLGVDASLLPEDRRRPHEHAVISQAMQLSAMKRVARQCSLAAHKRSTPPAILPPKDEPR